MVDIHVCFVSWDFGHLIYEISDWACGAGFIDVISTCEEIVQVGEAFYFFGVGFLHVFFPTTSSLTSRSASSTASHGLL